MKRVATKKMTPLETMMAMKVMKAMTPAVIMTMERMSKRILKMLITHLEKENLPRRSHHQNSHATKERKR